MSRHLRILLAVLCATLMLRPHTATAYPNISIGAGWAGDCNVRDKEDARGRLVPDCREGPRAEMLVDLFGRAEREHSPPSLRGSGNGAKSSGPNCIDCNLTGIGGNARDLAVALIVIVIAIMVIYGLVWGLAGLASAEIAVGLYASGDYFPRAVVEEDGTTQSGTMTRWGLQTSFFPFHAANFRMHLGIGPASWATRTEAEGEVLRDGYSTKVGLGVAPRPGQSGPFLFAESEYLALYARSFKDVLRNNDPTRTPEYRTTTAGLGGWTFAF